MCATTAKSKNLTASQSHFLFRVFIHIRVLLLYMECFSSVDVPIESNPKRTLFLFLSPGSIDALPPDFPGLSSAGRHPRTTVRTSLHVPLRK